MMMSLSRLELALHPCAVMRLFFQLTCSSWFTLCPPLLPVGLDLELLVAVGLTASVTITIGVPVKRAITTIGSAAKTRVRNFTGIPLATYPAMLCRYTGRLSSL